MRRHDCSEIRHPQESCIYRRLDIDAFTAVEMGVLFFIDDFWAYEFVLLPMLFSLGMIFTVGNTLAMNEGGQMPVELRLLSDYPDTSSEQQSPHL